MVSAFPESSDTSMDLITAVVAVGTVYKVVALVLVKSAFLFTNVFAIMLYRSFPLPPRLLNLVEMLNSVFVLHYLCHERKTVVSVDRILLKVGLMIVQF